MTDKELQGIRKDVEFLCECDAQTAFKLLGEIERLRRELQHIAHATTLDAATKWARQALEGESA